MELKKAKITSANKRRSASGRASRVSLYYLDPNISLVELLKIAKRATQSMMGYYRIALQLYKTFNHMLFKTEGNN
jgi:hypothetical protein